MMNRLEVERWEEELKNLLYEFGHSAIKNFEGLSQKTEGSMDLLNKHLPDFKSFIRSLLEKEREEGYRVGETANDMWWRANKSPEKTRTDTITEILGMVEGMKKWEIFNDYYCKDTGNWMSPTTWNNIYKKALDDVINKIFPSSPQ